MSILYRKPEPDCPYSQLEDIAGLIYDTDPYIYPAMFHSREEAVGIIPRMIQAGDRMFNCRNMFVAEEDGRIVGLILWIRGPLVWEPDIYCRCGGNSADIDKVCNEYFSQYSTCDDGIISVINCCVSSGKRNMGIGQGLLQSFMREVRGVCELFVLSDNEPAVRLYQRNGFRICGQYDGFSAEGPRPKCFRMVSNMPHDAC